jgi:uncharacterized delta-60 repeat protein
MFKANSAFFGFFVRISRDGVERHARRAVARRFCLAALLACAAIFAVTPLYAYVVQMPDTSFGIGGKVMTAVSPGTGDDVTTAVVIQPDRKIVVGGTCDKKFCMVRYLEDGTLDNTFGQFGRVIQSRLGEDTANAMVLQPDGKLILAGDCNVATGTNRRFCAARFTTTGALDTTFGDGSGWVEIDLRPTYDAAHAIALQSDGKIVLAGRCFTFNGSLYDFCLVRLLSNGSLDTSFNGSGSAIVPRRGNDTANEYATAVAIQHDDMILVAGYCEFAQDAFCAVRYKADGSGVDASFGGAGYIGWSTPNGDPGVTFGERVHSIALQPNGKFILGGNCNGRTCAVRFLADGARDTGFGTDGVVYGHNTIWSVPVAYGTATVRPDGSILLTGRWALYGWRDGMGTILDSGGNSVLGELVRVPSTEAVNVVHTGWRSHAQQADGKIVTIGQCDPNPTDFCVFRYESGPTEYRNCSLDIDGDGKVLATTDSLIHTRIALGMTGSAVISGIAFPANAVRKLWPDIRTYLRAQCGMAIP